MSATTIDNYILEKIHEIKTDYPDTKILESNSNVTFAGRPGYKLVYLRNSKDESFMVKKIEFGTFFNGKIYYINASAETSKYLEYGPIFDRMINSLEITPF